MCFCNGLEVHCEASNLYYNKIESRFQDNDDGWRVNNKFNNLSTSLNLKENGVEFVEFDEFPGEELFFYAPVKFLGNKLASYGGNLTFGIRYEGPSSGRPKRLEVRIAGGRVNLVHRVGRTFYPYYDNIVNIPLLQDEFRRFGDNARVDREHMLMALSNVETIMIRASFLETQYSVLLKQASIDNADPYSRSSSAKRASAVESCRCPSGYTGSSCESCAPGYRRAKGGFYLGLCEVDNEPQGRCCVTFFL
jgi:heparan sulfate proteoglycan 2 (perlecan)